MNTVKSSDLQRVSFYEQIDRNKRNSIVLALLVSLVLFAVSYAFFLLFGLLAFSAVLAVSVFYIFFTYSRGDQIVLNAVGAKPADEIKHRFLIDTAEGLSIAAGIPKPKVYVMEGDEINAFATGKDPQHASIAVTSGALNNLSRSELEGVIGHEISHIQNYDIKFATVIAVMVGLIAIISHIILRSFMSRRKAGGAVIAVILVAAILAIFAPLLSRLVQAAVSRNRELLADSNGVKLTRYPAGLSSALEKIKKMNKGKMDVSESVSHLFLADPNKSPLDGLFATHPPLEKRIGILRAMG